MRAGLLVNLPNDQDSTQRILPDLRPQCSVHQSNVSGLLVLGPTFEVVADKDDVILNPGDIGELGLEVGLVQIAVQALGELGFMVFETVHNSLLDPV